ncbi:MAG: phosphatase PAP2 family protein [Lachnospiraceae bacterium]
MEFLRRLAEIRTPAGDLFFQLVTGLGQQTVLLIVLCILLWCVNKKLGYQMGFAFCLSGILVYGMKITFRISRPWILDSKFQPVDSAVPGATGYSFPSGHTQSGTALWGSLAYSKKISCVFRLLFLVILILVGFSRMYLGVHTPKDVLTSLLFTFLIIIISSWILKKNSGEVAIPITLIGCGILLFFYSFFLYQSGVITHSYVAGSGKIIGLSLGFAMGALVEHKLIKYTEKASLKEQLMKLITGFLLLFILQAFLWTILKGTFVAIVVRNFLLMFYIVAVYPGLFTMVQGKIHNKNQEK